MDRKDVFGKLLLGFFKGFFTINYLFDPVWTGIIVIESQNICNFNGSSTRGAQKNITD